MRGKKLAKICRRIGVRNCRYEGGVVKNLEKNANVFYGWSLVYHGYLNTMDTLGYHGYLGTMDTKILQYPDNG